MWRTERRTAPRTGTQALLRLGALCVLASVPLLWPETPSVGMRPSLEELALSSVCRAHAARGADEGAR